MSTRLPAGKGIAGQRCRMGLLKKSYGTLPMPFAIGWSSEAANLLCR